jgi:hypothetical protein
MPDNIYVAKIIDEDGKTWVYEGTCTNGDLIWAEEKNSSPRYLNEIEAEDIAKTEVREGQRWEVVKMF